MNQLSRTKRRAIVAVLVGGSSIRAIVRMAGAAKNTVIKRLCCPSRTLGLLLALGGDCQSEVCAAELGVVTGGEV